MARKKTRREGQGTCWKRADGRWEAAITTGYNENGNPIRARVIRRTRKEAVESLTEMIVRKNCGLPLLEGNQSLEDFIESWMRTHVRPLLAPTTVRYYEQMTRLYILPKIGKKKLKDVTPQLVQGMLNELAKDQKLKANTVNGVRSTLRSALNTAKKWQLITINPMDATSPVKREKGDPVFLGQDEMRQLIEVASSHWLGPLIVTGLITGMRVGEATGLRWEDIDFDSGTFKIRNQLRFEGGSFCFRPPKSDAGKRNLPIVGTLAEVLKQQREQQQLWEGQGIPEFNSMGLVFTTIEGNPLHQSNIDKVVKQLCVKAGIPSKISFHKLRHTYATHLASQGVSLSLVKDLLGHSQISLTVNTYGHPVQEELRKAAGNIERLLQEP